MLFISSSSALGVLTCSFPASRASAPRHPPSARPAAAKAAMLSAVRRGPQSSLGRSATKRFLREALERPP